MEHIDKRYVDILILWGKEKTMIKKSYANIRYLMIFLKRLSQTFAIREHFQMDKMFLSIYV